MKLPIVNRTKYERLEELFDIQVKNNEELNKARTRVNDDYRNYQLNTLSLIPEKERKYNLPIIDNLKLLINNRDNEIKEQKKEISRLKSLLTRNGISYKKAEKK